MTDFKENDIVKFNVDGTEYYCKVMHVTPKKITVCDLDDYYEYTIKKDKAVVLEPVYLTKDSYRK